MGMTFLYAPPEVINGEWHGRSVDVFSLGVVFGEMIEYIFDPWQLSSVEKRVKERKEGKRRPEWYEPEEMTFKEELFLEQWMEGKPEGGLIEQWEMQLLLKVMTAKERGKRPTAKEVWKFLRGREFDVTVGNGGVPATCGECCL
jgi:serine/threonine protein kinase